MKKRLLCGLCMVLFFAFVVKANDVQWNGTTSSNWATASNWTDANVGGNHIPGATDIARIDYSVNNDTVVSDTESCKDVRVGNAASASVATLTIADGGSLETVGDLSTGSHGYFCIGSETGAPGRVTVQSGGTLIAGDNISVGRYSTGYFDVTGGTVTERSGGIYVGEYTNGQGHMNVSGGTINVGGSVRLFCNADAGSAEVVMTGGTMNVTSYVRLGQIALNKGSTFSLSGTSAENKGVLTTASYLGCAYETTVAGAENVFNLGEYGKVDAVTGYTIGRKGVGKFIMTGGEMLASGSIAGSGKVVVGEQANATGTWDVSGGTVSVNRYISIGYLSDVEQLFNVSGGSITTDDLDVGRDGTGRMVITGNAATITSNDLYVGAYKGPDDSALKLGKGTLEFKVGASGVTAIQALSSVTLDAGGAGSIADLIVSLAAAPPSGSILLVDNQGAGAVSGLFDSLNGGSAAEGAAVTLSFGGINYDYLLTYCGGVGGNDIMLIPEPATIIMFGFGMIAALRTRKH